MPFWQNCVCKDSQRVGNGQKKSALFILILVPMRANIGFGTHFALLQMSAKTVPQHKMNCTSMTKQMTLQPSNDKH